MNKNVIMCFSPGRSGSQLLARLLGLADDTHSVHEPEPTFQAVTEAVRTRAEETLRFVRDVKLPAILASPQPNYAETSHLFGKGPFEAFVELGVPFRLVMLHREPREVAKSHWRINAIPARAKKKQQYLLHPGLDSVMKMPGWEKMTNYQLCYWYCLEIERRKALYAEKCRARDIPVVEIHLAELLDFNTVKQLCESLSLSLGSDKKEQHAAMTEEKTNQKAKYWPKLSLTPFASQERKVWEVLGSHGEALFRDVAARYAWQAAA
ncbi:MAG: hypothetical protein KKB37_16010 [Alphaproteobacteria bacterium]|nr:hypothetical protein [Alphaproteobacteria bacterium]